MSAIENSIRIDAAPPQVWAVLADLEAVAHYNPLISAARRTSPNTAGVGASRHCDLIPKGWVKERVIAWEPVSAIEMELVESQWPVSFMKWRTMLAPEGTGTRVSQLMEYRVKFGVLGKLLDVLVMKRKLHKSIDEIFVNLKNYVERNRTA